MILLFSSRGSGFRPRFDFSLAVELLDVEGLDVEAFDAESFDVEALDVEAVDLEAVDLVDIKAKFTYHQKSATLTKPKSGKLTEK